MKFITSFILFFTLTSISFSQVYVSNDGDNRNPGTIDEPVANLFTAKSLAREGQTLFLEKGSEWKEELNLRGKNLLVDAYGDGPLPIINGADSNFLWSELRDGVFSTTWFGNSGHVRVWDNGKILKKVGSIDEVVAGTYFFQQSTSTPSFQGFPAIPIISVNVAVGPLTSVDNIEIARRLYCINGDDQLQVSNVEVKNAQVSNLVADQRGVLKNILSLNGYTEGIKCGTHDIFNNVCLLNVDQEVFAKAFSANNNVPHAGLKENLVLIDKDPENPGDVNGLYAKTPKGIYASSYGKHISGVGLGAFPGQVQAAYTFYDRCYAYKCSRFEGPVEGLNVEFWNFVWNGHPIYKTGSIRGTLSLKKSLFLMPSSSSEPFISLDRQSTNLNMYRVRWIGEGNVLMDNLSEPNQRITAYETVFFNVKRAIVLKEGTQYLGNDNIFYVPGTDEIHIVVGDRVFTKLKEWQDYSGQDQESLYLTDQQAANFFVHDPFTGNTQLVQNLKANLSNGDEVWINDWRNHPYSVELPRVPKNKDAAMDYLNNISGPWFGKGQEVWVSE